MFASCSIIIAAANTIDITVCHVGNSLKINIVIIPNTSVPTPNPINLTFQTPPNISYDYVADLQNSHPIGSPKTTTAKSLENSCLKNGLVRNCPCN